MRPPGGAWGAPQVILTDPRRSRASQVAVSDNGDAIATWSETGAGTWSKIRPAGGVWGGAEKVSDLARDFDVAMSASGDAIVLLRDNYPGTILSSYRTGPPAGSWGATQEVLKNNYPDTLKGMMVEFDGLGRAVALADFREFVDTVRVNVRGVARARGARRTRSATPRRRSTSGASQALTLVAQGRHRRRVGPPADVDQSNSES